MSKRTVCRSRILRYYTVYGTEPHVFRARLSGAEPSLSAQAGTPVAFLSPDAAAVARAAGHAAASPKAAA